MARKKGDWLARRVFSPFSAIGVSDLFNQTRRGPEVRGVVDGPRVNVSYKGLICAQVKTTHVSRFPARYIAIAK
jgi:hypothetical protein